MHRAQIMSSGQLKKTIAGYSKSTVVQLQKSRLHVSSSVASSRAATNDQDYLHKSIVPTDHFQRSLPRLPVPKLEDTCRKYVAALTPLINHASLEKTQKVVDEFKNGEGKVLQEALVARDKKNKHTNYISGPWFDMYLKDRRPVVLTHNPYIVYNDDSRPEYNNQLVRATNFVVSSLRMMKTIRSNVLEPEVYHLNPEKSDNEKFRRFVSYLPKSVSWYGAYWYMAFPLDMSQYGRLFNSTRIPRPDKDELYTDEKARHILVLRNGHQYVFDVLDKDGNILSGGEIMSQLESILSDKTPAPSHCPSILTGDGRDVWCKARQLLENNGNSDTLRQIDGAIMTLSLEDTKNEEPNDLSKLFLYGDAANRWFDKSFTLIITGTGKSALNFEHSWGDGVAVLRYMNETFKDTTEKPAVSAVSLSTQRNTSTSTVVKRLEWRLNDELKKTIEDSNKRFKDWTSRVDIDYFQYTKFGKKLIKKNKLSPDSFMQLAIQMAFYKQYGQTVATYESCSTAAFKHGRTETIRPATTATKAACELFASGKASVEELRQSLELCSKLHGQLTKDAAMGQGFDRHLFGLKYQAELEGRPLPPLYQDPSYPLINHNILSTSTLSSPAILIGGFAPVVPDGYGVGYGCEEDFLGCNVTSYPPARNVRGFLDCMKESFDDLNAVLEGRKPK